MQSEFLCYSGTSCLITSYTLSPFPPWSGGNLEHRPECERRCLRIQEVETWAAFCSLLTLEELANDFGNQNRKIIRHNSTTMKNERLNCLFCSCSCFSSVLDRDIQKVEFKM